VREWRDTVASLPPGYGATKAYKGLSLREVASKARKAGAAKLSPTTVNKYLSTISPFLGWCVRNGFAERNPCDDLFYDLRKGQNPRPPFSSEQLQAILASPLFVGFQKDGREHVPGNQQANDWRFWIPLVCLFTGARIGEIAQLKTDDLQIEDAVPFISIRHDESREQTTKSGQTRIMPLHPKLVQIGFVAFVEEQRARSLGNASPWLFPEIVVNERGSRGTSPSRFWRNYLHRIGIKAKADGYGSHSFRHALADKLRLSGYLDEEIKVVLGHSHKSVTSGYGIVRQGTVSRIIKMISEIEFEEVDVLINILSKGCLS
jgi:integrase